MIMEQRVWYKICLYKIVLIFIVWCNILVQCQVRGYIVVICSQLVEMFVVLSFDRKNIYFLFCFELYFDGYLFIGYRLQFCVELYELWFGCVVVWIECYRLRYQYVEVISIRLGEFFKVGY